MSAPSDDFFGIQYISSTEQQSSSNSQDAPQRRSSPPSPSRRAQDNGNSQDEKVSGTEYLDNAFFPGVKEREDALAGKSSVSDDLDGGSNEFESQYFRRISEQEAHTNRLSALRQSAENDAEEHIPAPPKQKLRKTQPKMPNRLDPADDRGYLRDRGEDYGETNDWLTSLRECTDFDENEFDYIPRDPLRRYDAEKTVVHAKEESVPLKQPPQQKLKKEKKPKKERLVYADEESQPSGLTELRGSFLPVWQMNDEQLVDFLAQSVIYSDANLIAFDKPYGLAYSGGKAGEQFDRMLQQVKAQVAPKVERLHLVRSLDKHQSGVLLFATNTMVQSEVKDMLKSDAAKLTHRCLVRRGSQKMPLNVTVPLVKKIEKYGLKLTPLLSNNQKGDISYGETSLKVISENKNYVAYVEATTIKEAAHQLRCHLNLAGMPLIGDGKYGGNSGRPPRLSSVVLNQLGVSENQSGRIPAYSHLMKMEFPSPNAKQAANVRITAPLPHHFTWILRKLKLLKIRR